MDRVHLCCLRVCVVGLNLTHAGLRKAGHDDAGVRKEVNLLLRCDALRDAVVEGGIVLAAHSAVVASGISTCSSRASAHGSSGNDTNDERGSWARLDESEEGNGGESEFCGVGLHCD